MWWECSECGGGIERPRPPTVCPECGMAGVVFVPAEVGIEGDPDADSLRDSWLLRGVELAAAGA